MEKQGQVGIYRLYKLGRLAGSTFDKNIKVLERDLHSITHDYADKVNEFSHINGLLYEYDEKASKLYWDKKPYKEVKEFTKFEEIKEDVIDDELELLKIEYEELSGKKAHYLWKSDKLTEKIEELKK